MTLEAIAAERARLVEEQARDLEWLDRVEREAPLAVGTLWRAGPEELAAARALGGDLVDQRTAVEAVMRAPTVGLVLGGERSGKSLGMKLLTLALALGSDHPHVQSWLALNELPLDVIPAGPATGRPGAGAVYAVALTSDDSRRYHREDFASLVQAMPHKWINRNAHGEAKLSIWVPGHREPAVIYFMSVEQGPRRMQGISLRWAWIDEEPAGEVGQRVYRHLKGRVADQDGRIGISMVPTEGYTWVHDDLVRDRQDEAVVVHLDSLMNPHLPGRRMARHFGGMEPDEVAQRRFGRFRARTGIIYTLWNPGSCPEDWDRWEGTSHLVEPFDPTEPLESGGPRVQVRRYRGADFGLVLPTCVLDAFLADDDTLYVYREYYEPNGESYEWHAERYLETQEGEEYEAGWGDPGGSGKEARAAFGDAGVYLGPADNEVKGGIDRVRNRLRLQGDGRPRLRVFRGRCPNLEREIAGYSWDPKRKDEAPLKINDHAMDGLRYLVQGVHRYESV